MPARVLLLTALFLPLAVFAQDGTGEKEREPKARVSRTDGKSLMRSPGDKDWKKLETETILETGDRVKAGKKGSPLELVVPSDRKQLAERASNDANRVVLAPGAEVTVAPPGKQIDLRLDVGEVFAAARDALRIQAGKSVLTVKEGDAQLELSKKGALDLTVHSGNVHVQGPDGQRDVGERMHLSVDARGKVLRLKKLKKLKTPKFMRVNPQALVFYIDHRTWPKHNAQIKGGTATPTHIAAEDPEWEDPESDNSGDWTRQVHLERYAAKGLFEWTPGLRVRVRFKINRETPLGLFLRFRDASEGGYGKFEGRVMKPRKNVWTEVDFDPTQFPDAEALKAAPAGLQVHILTVFAGLYEHVPDRKDLKLEVNRILVYVPAGK